MPYTELRAADPLAKALDVAGLKTASWIVSFGAVVSLTAVLLVFQYGQPRIFFAMARDGLLPAWAAKVSRSGACRHITTWVTGVVVAVGALFADENEIYDLTNIGTLSAFAIVCVGVLVLRYLGSVTAAAVPRAVRVAGHGARYVRVPVHDVGLPRTAWERFGIWLAIGAVIYVGYGYRHSRLRAGAVSAASSHTLAARPELAPRDLRGSTRPRQCRRDATCARRNCAREDRQPAAATVRRRRRDPSSITAIDTDSRASCAAARSTSRGCVPYPGSTMAGHPQTAGAPAPESPDRSR